MGSVGTRRERTPRVSSILNSRNFVFDRERVETKETTVSGPENAL